MYHPTVRCLLFAVPLFLALPALLLTASALIGTPRAETQDLYDVIHSRAVLPAEDELGSIPPIAEACAGDPACLDRVMLFLLVAGHGPDTVNDRLARFSVNARMHGWDTYKVFVGVKQMADYPPHVATLTVSKPERYAFDMTWSVDSENARKQLRLATRAAYRALAGTPLYHVRKANALERALQD